MVFLLHTSTIKHLFTAEKGRKQERNVKTTTYIFAAVLGLLSLSCSQNYDSVRANRSGAELELNHPTAWGMIGDRTEDGQVALRRLESITWDSVKHELTWDVSRGEKKGETYQPTGTDRYEIKMDSATMTVNGESRRFSEEEAQNVRTLMDFISRYALESTVWWENGEGEPVDGSGTPKPGKQQERNNYRNNGEVKGKNIHVISLRE